MKQTTVHLQKTAKRLGLLLGGLLLLTPVLTSAGNVDRVAHYDRGYSPSLRAYLTLVLDLALEKSEDEYGSYELAFYSKPLSTSRAKLETEKGELVNVLFAPSWSGNMVDPDNVIRLEHPIFNGMLGLRKLVVKRWHLDEIAAVDSVPEFMQLQAGLGASWVEVEIFHANDVHVVEAQMYDALFPMLDKRRFDYLPLSILEADSALASKRILFPELAISDDLYLYYPLPTYLYVNGEQKHLAERLSYGLTKALEDGSLKALFHAQFADVGALLNKRSRKLAIIRNPYITDERNDQLIDTFKKEYGLYFKLLK